MAEVSGTAGIPDVAPDVRGITGVDASPNAFGGLIAQGEEKAAEGAQKGLDIYGQVAADHATNNWHDQANKILYGDPSKTVTGPDGAPQPDTGFFGLRGAAAMAARPQVAAELDEAAKEARSGLFTPESQLQFDQDTRRSRFYMDQQTSQHADQQQQNWMISTNETKAALKLNTLGANPLDPAVKADAINGVREAYVRTAAAKGENPQAAVLRADQDVALTQIRALVVNNPQSAQRILNTNAGVLASRPDYDQIARQVQSAVDEATISPMIDQAVTAAHRTSLLSTTQGVPASGPNVIAPGTVPTEANAEAFVNSAFPGATITSEQRTPGHNAAVGGAPNSMHITGNAIDFVPPKGVTKQQVADALDKAGLPHTELLDEGNHIHWGWRPQGAAALQTYPTPADYLRTNEPSILDTARSQAEAAFPGRPQEVDRVVDGVRRGIEQTITAQGQQNEVATHVVIQAMSADHPPISEAQLMASSPQNAQAWRTMQIYNPLGAMSIQRVFDANSRGRATTLGTQFGSLFSRALLPTGDPNRITDPSTLFPLTEPGENGPLTNTGLAQLSSIIQGRRTPQGEADAAALRGFFAQAHTQLSLQNPTLGIYDPVGEKKYQEFMMQALPMIAGERASNKPLPTILAPKGDVYNSMFQFKRPMGKDIMDRILDTANVDVRNLANGGAAPDIEAQKAALRASWAAAKTPEARAAIVAQSVKNGWATAPLPQVPLPQ